jgi:hypothetical protein
VDVLTEEIEKCTRSLEGLILPGSLMDCFEYHRRQEMRKAASSFNDNELSWFLHMMNEFRGVDDRKEDFDLLFDPVMYMIDHPAWTLPPGLEIELPPLNTAVFAQASTGSMFRQIAEDEVARLRTLADTYPDDAVIGLARIAVAAHLDDTPIVDRRMSIRYLAMNTSAKLEDLWAGDDTLWLETGTRKVTLPDVVAELKAELLQQRAAIAEEKVTEKDLVCYTEGEIKYFAFNPDKFLLSGKTRHMPLCGLCQEQIARWIETVRKAEEKMLSERDGQVRLH